MSDSLPTAVLIDQLKHKICICEHCVHRKSPDSSDYNHIYIDGRHPIDAFYKAKLSIDQHSITTVRNIISIYNSANNPYVCFDPPCRQLCCTRSLYAVCWSTIITPSIQKETKKIVFARTPTLVPLDLIEVHCLDHWATLTSQ